jgi:hypothetical protein
VAEFVLARCRSCNGAVIWTTNVQTGKRMPVNPTPRLGGNVVLTSGNDGPEARVLPPSEVKARQERGIELHVSHFATCPQAGSWRKR